MKLYLITLLLMAALAVYAQEVDSLSQVPDSVAVEQDSIVTSSPSSLEEVSAFTPTARTIFQLQTNFAYASWNQHETSFLQQYALRYQTVKAGFGMEDIWQKKKKRQNHLRTDSQAFLEWNPSFADLEWQGHWLEGSYANLYPSFAHRLATRKSLDLKEVLLIPEISESYSHYPVLSAYQTEIKLTVVRSGKWLICSNAFLYHDYDAPGMDTRHHWATLDAGFSFLKNFSLDVFTSNGDRTFYVGKDIGVIDNYISAKNQTGIFLSYKRNTINAGLHYSQSKQTDDKNISTLSLGLGIDFSLNKVTRHE